MSPDERQRSATIYNKTVAGTKDLNAMKVKAAGINKDTQLKTPKQLRQGLLESNFSVSFQKEIDQFTTNNLKLFPRYRASEVRLDLDNAAKESYKAHDNKTNWTLQQISLMSRAETPIKTPDRNEADKKLL